MLLLPFFCSWGHARPYNIPPYIPYNTPIPSLALPAARAGVALGPIYVQPEIVAHPLLAPSPPLLFSAGAGAEALKAGLRTVPLLAGAAGEYLSAFGQETGRGLAATHPSHPSMLELLASGEVAEAQRLAVAAAAPAGRDASPAAAAMAPFAPHLLYPQQAQQALPQEGVSGTPSPRAPPAPDLGSSGGLHSPQQAQQAGGDAAAPDAAAASAAHLEQALVALNVGGHRFLTAAATLAVVEGSVLWELAQRGAGAGGARAADAAPEFFVDRSGKVRLPSKIEPI